MNRESAGDSAFDLALKRLDRASALLEQRLAAAGTSGGELFDLDRSRLAADLERSRAREKALEAAGVEASDALGRAITQIKDVLAGQDAVEA